MAYTAKRLLLPTVPIHTDMLARIAALRGAIAAARHRLRHGDWPTADQLAPPTDPYTGDPLIYRRDDDRCVIYSVGADGVDQHGADDDVACILRD